MSFNFVKTEIDDVMIIEPQVFGDSRGYFMEVFKSSVFKDYGIDKDFSQVNQSRSSKNVLRGLHYQLNPNAQAKLVRVVHGEIFDVVVDIRKDSPTYGKWVSALLSADNKKTLYVPEGFAHGFCVLSEIAEIIYYCSSEYSPESERSILWNDSDLKIDWPLDNPVLSDKDQLALPLSDAENNFVYA